MKRILLTIAALLSLALATPSRSAEAAVSVGVSINTGGPYRGISLQFQSHPDVALIPSSRVYYVRNYDRDLYRYGSDWYYVQDDCWYRGSSYRGPFVEISVSSVPYDVFHVPSGYRRHWGGPPSHAPAYGYRRNRSHVNQDTRWDRYQREDRNRGGRNHDSRWSRGNGRDRDRNQDRGRDRDENRWGGRSRRG